MLNLDVINLIIVEDHPIYRLGLATRIETMGGPIKLVGQAADGPEAIALVNTLKPDVVLMDLKMPGMSGIEASRIILESNPEVKIIVLSAGDDMKDINDVLQVGVSAYLTKSVSVEDLVKGIYKVMEGESAFSPEIAKSLLGILKKPSVEISSLSPREEQILEEMAKGWTNKKIAQELYLSVRTVEAHVSQIFRKLGVTTRTEAVTRAIRENLI